VDNLVDNLVDNFSFWWITLLWKLNLLIGRTYLRFLV